MTKDSKKQSKQDPPRSDIGRRDFVAVSVTAGLASACSSSTEEVAETPAGPPYEVVETDVEITTADGTSDAAYFHPATGSYPGVLIWTDAFGLRPSFRAIGRRLAAEGYSVLVPNPFYRVSRSPQFEDASTVNFARDRAQITPLMASIGAAGAAETDAAAYIAFLDGQPEVDTTKPIGTQGYCMGGPLVMRTAASQADRVGAGASFHGGGLVTDNENSPHLLAPKIKAKMYFGIASSDDANQPEAKDVLREAFGDQAEVEVYTGVHGWCIPDMPAQANGDPTYLMEDAERAWGKLLELYASALV